MTTITVYDGATTIGETRSTLKKKAGASSSTSA